MNQYQNIIDFIDAAIDSDDLMRWLAYMEKLPDNLRWQQFVKMKHQMLSNNEPSQILYILELISNPQILSAINAVINDVYESGMRTKKYIKKHDNTNFKILISLIAAT